MTAAIHRPTTAADILQLGLATLEQRGRDRDQPDGERTMPSVVRAFEALTGHRVTEQQGWLFMALIKVKRSQSGAPDLDHYVDGANYFALAGESALAARAPQPVPGPWIRERKCLTCDGLGRRPLGSSVVPCNECNSTGIERYIDCPTCERTGLLLGSGGNTAVACPTCNGAGDLPR